MSHLNIELKRLKNDVMEMWSLVISQMEKSKLAVENCDKNLVNEIKANERRVDAFELKLDMDCENILALFNPVANDLRFVLSVIKINYNLERIGDYARGISRCVHDVKSPFTPEFLQDAHIITMFDLTISMLKDTLESFETETNQKAIEIFSQDKYLDEVNSKANATVANLIKKEPEKINDTLLLLDLIRKLERVGDQTQNIAEEIIFYIEAKVLKHQKLKTL
jgi:phosphate transport system protein